jgi:hypothetical protein
MHGKDLHVKLKRPQRRSRRRQEDNIKTTLKKYNGKVWTGFFWLRI